MKNKAYLNGLKKYYHKVPTKLYTMNMSIEAVALYCYLASCGEEFNPSIRMTAHVLNVSPNRLRKAYQELVDCNTIKCYHKGFKRVTKKFEFVPIHLWKVRQSRRLSVDTRIGVAKTDV